MNENPYASPQTRSGKHTINVPALGWCSMLVFGLACSAIVIWNAVHAPTSNEKLMQVGYFVLTIPGIAISAGLAWVECKSRKTQ